MAEDSNETPKSEKSPQTAEDYSRRGWLHLAAHEDDDAISNFQQAVTMDARLVEAAYGLGMALKARNQRPEAIQAFDRALELLDDGAVEDKAREVLLKRIIMAQRKFIEVSSEGAAA